MSAELCLPVAGGQSSVALRCSSSGTGTNTCSHVLCIRLLCVVFNISMVSIITASFNEYVGGACGSVATESTVYSPNTCTATSSLTSLTTPHTTSLNTPTAQSRVDSPLVTQTKSGDVAVTGLGGAADNVAAFRVSCAERNTDYTAIISVVQVRAILQSMRVIESMLLCER